MSPVARQRVGWALSGVVCLLLAASAVDKIFGSAHSLEMTRSFGIAPATYQMLGVVELASAVLFLVPRTSVLGVLLLASYMGGAIATHLQHQQSVVFPAVFQAWVWVAAAVRMPQLFAGLGLKRKIGHARRGTNL